MNCPGLKARAIQNILIWVLTLNSLEALIMFYNFYRSIIVAVSIAQPYNINPGRPCAEIN